MSIWHQSKICFHAKGKPTIAIVAIKRDGAREAKYILGFRKAIKSDGDKRGEISFGKGRERLSNLDVLITFESKDNIDAVIESLQMLKDDDLWEGLKENK